MPAPITATTSQRQRPVGPSAMSVDPLQASALSDPLTRPSQPMPMDRQLGVLYAASEAAAPSFEGLVSGWAKHLGGQAQVRPGVKDIGRSAVKGMGAGDKAVSSQRDTLAGTIMFDSLPKLADGVDGLSKAVAQDGASVVRLKNRIDNGNTRDFLVNVRLKSGLVVEVQLHLKPVMEVKSGKDAGRRPKNYTADGKAGKSLLDANGVIMGQKELHTHDAYDYSRVLESLQEALDGSDFAHAASETSVRPMLQRAATVRQLGDVEQYKASGDDKKVALRMAAIQSHLKPLKDNLDKLQAGLMGEVWKQLSAGKDNQAAFERLKQVKAVTDQDPDQDIAGLEAYGRENDPAFASNLQAQIAKAKEAFAKVGAATSGRPSPAAVNDLRGILTRHAKLLRAELSKKSTHMTNTNNHVEGFAKQLDRLAGLLAS